MYQDQLAKRKNQSSLLKEKLKEKLKEYEKNKEDEESEEDDDSLSDPLKSNDSESSGDESSPEVHKKGKNSFLRKKKKNESSGADSSPEMRKKGKKNEEITEADRRNSKACAFAPARGRRIEASYMLNQVMFPKLTTRSVTLIIFITGEILRAKLARPQRKERI